MPAHPLHPPSTLAGSLLVVVVLLVSCRAPATRPEAQRIEIPLLAPPPEAILAESHASEQPRQETTLHEHSLAAYRLHAARHNPELRGLYESWRAQAQRGPQASALPEPRLTYTEFLESVETRTGPQERSFALRQEFPWFGKRRLRGEIEDEKANAAWHRFLAAQLALDHNVRATYADYFFLGRSVAVTRENLDLLTRLERVARENFAAGAENHPDVIRLQVEIGGLEDRLNTLLDMKQPVGAKLGALLNLPPSTDLPWPERLPQDDFQLDEEATAEWLDRHNPELVALAHDARRSELSRELAAKEYFPDLAVGVQTIATGSARAPGTRGSGDDPWLLSFSVELPLWFAKYRAGVREAEARQRVVVEERRGTRNRLSADIEMARYQLRDAQRRLKLYGGGLVRKAKEALASTEASFQADRSDFGDLIDAERVLLDYQLARERARADRLRAAALLDRYLGRFVVTGRASQNDSGVSAQRTTETAP